MQKDVKRLIYIRDMGKPGVLANLIYYSISLCLEK